MRLATSSRPGPSCPFPAGSRPVRLACYTHQPHPEAKIVVHFHGNGQVAPDHLAGLMPALEQLGYNGLQLPPQYNIAASARAVASTAGQRMCPRQVDLFKPGGLFHMLFYRLQKGSGRRAVNQTVVK